MPEAQQATTERARNKATITAMADVLAAIGSDGGIMGWADEDPADRAPAGRIVPASGATIGHGRIRLRDSAPPTYLEDPAAPPAVRREVVGHGTIRLRAPAAAPPPPSAK